jgi:hypothetical protein
MCHASGAEIPKAGVTLHRNNAKDEQLCILCAMSQFWFSPLERRLLKILASLWRFYTIADNLSLPYLG